MCCLNHNPPLSYGCKIERHKENQTPRALHVCVNPQDRKADMEEEKLVAVHPAYKTYKEEVSKFVPTLY